MLLSRAGPHGGCQSVSGEQRRLRGVEQRQNTATKALHQLGVGSVGRLVGLSSQGGWRPGGGLR
eukprot:2344435-Pyramimonas_sp.AAC.4